MAVLLELQLWDFNGGQTSGITVFASSDDAIEEEFHNYTKLPCEMYFENLVGFDDGSIINTFLEGFVINV